MTGRSRQKRTRAPRADAAKVKNSSPPWWAPAPLPPNGRVVKNPLRRLIAGLLIAGVLTGLGAVAALNPGRLDVPGTLGRVTHAPSMGALAEGCAGVTTWPGAPDAENGYINPGEPFATDLAPPISGNFSKTPWAGAKILTPTAKVLPTPSEALSLQYRGWTVAWYRMDAPDEVIRPLLDVAKSLPADAKVLVSPWPLDAETTWRKGRVIILAGWNTTEPCLGMNADILREFQAALPVAPGNGVPLSEPGAPARASTAERLAAAATK